MTDEEIKAITEAWRKSCIELSKAFQEFAASVQQASSAIDDLNHQLNIDREWPDVVYEDILDAEIVEF